MLYLGKKEIMICIYQTQDSIHAHLVKHQLEEMRISTLLKTNDALGALSHLRAVNPIEIYVAEEDAEKAKKILLEVDPSRSSN